MPSTRATAFEKCPADAAGRSHAFLQALMLAEQYRCKHPIIKMKCPEGTAWIVPYSASPEPLRRTVGAAQEAIRTYPLDESCPQLV